MALFMLLTVRASLLPVVCNIPGLARVAGYLGHSARLGCTKCLKPFPTAHFGEKPGVSTKISGPSETHQLTGVLQISTRYYQTDCNKKHWSRSMGFSNQNYYNYCILKSCISVWLAPCTICSRAGHAILWIILEKGLLARNALAVVEQRIVAIKPTSTNMTLGAFLSIKWSINLQDS